jgi:hypothetical protein
MNMKRTFITLSILAAMATQGGNPVRSGSAGAPELLINPWALTAGWAEANTANVMGLESLYGNVAGLAHVDKFQFGLANTQWLVGTGIQFNTAAFATPTGNGGVLGVHISNMNYGEIEVTTTELPDGGAGYFKPTSSIIGMGYAKQFTNSIYGGINIKMYSSSMSNLTATGVCFDAGIQYVTGEDDDFRFGITLRNIGPSFGYSGDGMSIILPVPTGSHSSSFQSGTEDFELPTQLSIGMSKRFDLSSDHRIEVAGNFISNSFKKDQFTAAFEYGFKSLFAVRMGYAAFDNRFDGMATEAMAGPSAGFSINPETGNGGSMNLSYAYRMTNGAFGGIHTLGATFIL